MTRTYLDANVLIAAFQGKEPLAANALQVLDDPGRTFVVSDFLRLEVLPKPTFHNRTTEIEFMNLVLDKAQESVTADKGLTEKAIKMASRYDLSPVDSLHISAATKASVDEFVTMEKSTKPMFGVEELTVTSLYSDATTVD
jgi:predicted nucleic acid-binding protein